MAHEHSKLPKSRLCNLPDDPNESWEAGFIDGQLLPHGASSELIDAVSRGDEAKIREALQEVESFADRTQLGKMIQRLAPIIGAER